MSALAELLPREERVCLTVYDRATGKPLLPA
jgi:hypothetical protein